MATRVTNLGVETWVTKPSFNRVTNLGVEVWTNLTVYTITGVTGTTGTTGVTGPPPPELELCDVCDGSPDFINLPPWLYNFQQITRS